MAGHCLEEGLWWRDAAVDLDGHDEGLNNEFRLSKGTRSVEGESIHRSDGR